MKAKSTIDRRPWHPMAWITDSGLVLSPSHVVKVCRHEQATAVYTVATAIRKMMR